MWSKRPSKFCLLTIIERKTRYLYARKLPTRKSKDVCNEIIDVLRDLKPKSITIDRGKEFALYELLEKELECNVYFSDPGKPYQRGSIENVNGLLRQYFPKKTDFKNVTKKSINKAVYDINTRPRKIFEYLTAEEMLLLEQLK
ncbi:IS30 family transposase [Macrococcus capreoli]|uniref:IS30 family transposase n=1 Tax=Macrococcus capreoli TaxID=2982690 RepID=UPI0021D5C491|nr:IS30 family transposase [Macrococcus sp. TMW 2.2395]MCU7557646.1 IS30 family transposase [Macrococcus sp. TMW 2.2395]